MSKASEALEHAEHASHGGHGGGGIGKMIGLTMALLGVLLAFCTAQVGAARTELIKTMVEQTQAVSERQSQSAKYRMLFSQLEQLRAIAPTPAQVKELRQNLEQLRGSARPEQMVAAQGAQMVGVGIAEMLEPTPAPLARLIGLTRRTGYKADVAKHWIEAYEPAISAYGNEAEGFERAQLCAEIGIVLASIALLLSNRRAWYGSAALGALCAVALGYTAVRERPRLHAAEIAIEIAHHHYIASSGGVDEHAEDEQTLGELTAGMAPDLLRVAGGGVPTGESEHHTAPEPGHSPAAVEHEPRN